MLLYHKSCKKKSGRPESLPLQCVCAAMSGSGSRSTYRSKAILRSTLPSGALLMAAVICCRSSPCSAAGSTTRAAATGSTEPERLRQLSGVAHHIANDGKMVCFREVTKTFADHFRDVPKLLLCGVHLGDITGMLVCSACHDVLLTAFAALLLPGQRKTESPCSWSPL